MTHTTPSAHEPAAGGNAPPAMSGRAYLRLVLLGAAIGIPAALVAALFLALVHDLEHWLWHDLPDSLGHSSPPWYLVIGLPVGFVGAAESKDALTSKATRMRRCRWSRPAC